METGCTSNADTWTCFPFKTFDQNQAGSTAWFNWEIKAGPGADKFRVSTVDSPLHIQFKETDMTLADKGQDSEHYTFRTTIEKMVQPATNLTADNALVSCFYNSTTFQASLYTKEPKTFPADGQDVQGISFEEWPYRVSVEEIATGGSDVPNCYKTVDGELRDRVTESIEPQAAGAECRCLYKNWR